MRTFTSLLLAVALTGVAVPAGAQQPPATETAPTQSGSFEVGVLGTTVDGDGARYERYRDLRDGPFLDAFRWNIDKNGWLADAMADHVGRRDQRLGATAERPGKLKLGFLWDKIPMLMTRTAETFFTTGSPGVLVIDDPIQAAVQLAPASLATVFDSKGHQLEISSFRHIVKGQVEYLATPDVTLHALTQYTRREGNMPFGGSFGHSSLVETPVFLDHTLTDVDAGAEYGHGPLLLRGNYTASLFHNENQTLTFDSPFRLTDTTSVPGRGRIALAPSNSFLGVHGLASLKLAHRTRLSGTLSLNSLSDTGDTVIPPHTINTMLPVIPLERSTVDGKARTTGATLTLTSRPTKYLDIDVRYRFYDYDNQTPPFAITQRVAYDNAVSTLAAPNETEPFGVKRQSFDANMRLVSGGSGTAGVGYTRNVEDRTHRIFESTNENGVYATFDLPSYRVLTLRTRFDHTQKRGVGDPAEIKQELNAIGEQGGMRHFDIASRNRDRATLIGSLLVKSNVGVTFSVAGGKDDYLESEFGMRDGSLKIYSLGLDGSTGDHVTFGASYEYERDKAFARSRQANPGVQFDDPTRNWAQDGKDRVHSAIVNLGLKKLANKVDIDLSYDYNDTKATYDYVTGPVGDRTLPDEVPVDTTLPPPTPLPPVKSRLSRGTMDVNYALNSRFGIGFSFWYEDYNVQDFTMDIEANQDLARGQALLIGYIYRPYTAYTSWARLTVRW